MSKVKHQPLAILYNREGTTYEWLDYDLGNAPRPQYVFNTMIHNLGMLRSRRQVLGEKGESSLVKGSTHIFSSMVLNTACGACNSLSQKSKWLFNLPLTLKGKYNKSCPTVSCCMHGLSPLHALLSPPRISSKLDHFQSAFLELLARSMFFLYVS